MNKLISDQQIEYIFDHRRGILSSFQNIQNKLFGKKKPLRLSSFRDQTAHKTPSDFLSTYSFQNQHSNNFPDKQHRQTYTNQKQKQKDILKEFYLNNYLEQYEKNKLNKKIDTQNEDCILEYDNGNNYSRYYSSHSGKQNIQLDRLQKSNFQNIKLHFINDNITLFKPNQIQPKARSQFKIKGVGLQGKRKPGNNQKLGDHIIQRGSKVDSINSSIRKPKSGKKTTAFHGSSRIKVYTNQKSSLNRTSQVKRRKFMRQNSEFQERFRETLQHKLKSSHRKTKQKSKIRPDTIYQMFHLKQSKDRSELLQIIINDAIVVKQCSKVRKK